MKSILQKSSLSLIGLGLTISLTAPFAQAQTASDATTETKSSTISSEKAPQDDTARQTMTKRLRRLGVNLDWHKATLAQLKQTFTDLVAAGDDEDLRMRIILAARLRENGVKVNWRNFSADELTEKYTDSMQGASRHSEMAQSAPTETRDNGSVTVTTSDEYVEPAPLPRVRQPRQLTDAELEAMAVANQPPPQVYIQPVPVYVQDFGSSVTYLPNNNCGVYPGQTIVTSDGLTITSNSYSRYPRPLPPQNCPPYQGGTTYRQPPVPGFQRPLTLPGGKPGVPGVIPIDHPRIPWLYGN